MTAVILHPYVPGHREADQGPTWRVLGELRQRWEVEDMALGADPYGYWAGLFCRWHDGRTWLVIEHDIEPSIGLVEEMLECPETMCTRPYATGPGQHEAVAQFEAGRVPWSVAASLGCTKIAPAARAHPWPLPQPVHWSRLDTELTSRMTRLPGEMWHLHWGRLVHHHNYEEAQ